MKKKAAILLLVLFIIVGSGMILYPAISNIMREHQKDEILTEYDNSVSKQDDTVLKNAMEAAQRYNESLLNQVVLTDPFDDDSIKDLDSQYSNLLNINGDGIMGYVDIPRINVYEPIYHGTSDTVLTKGTGHLLHTSLPVGGESTHAVISGHTGLQDAEIFTNLTELDNGDIFYIHVLGNVLAYQVDQISVVEPDDVSKLYIENGKDYVTLVTCTPYGVNSHRLLVRGTRIPYTQAVQKISDDQKDEGVSHYNWTETYVKSIIEGVLLALAIFILIKIVIKLVKIVRRR